MAESGAGGWASGGGWSTLQVWQAGSGRDAVQLQPSARMPRRPGTWGWLASAFKRKLPPNCRWGPGHLEVTASPRPAARPVPGAGPTAGDKRSSPPAGR